MAAMHLPRVRRLKLYRDPLAATTRACPCAPPGVGSGYQATPRPGVRRVEPMTPMPFPIHAPGLTAASVRMGIVRSGQRPVSDSQAHAPCPQWPGRSHSC